MAAAKSKNPIANGHIWRTRKAAGNAAEAVGRAAGAVKGVKKALKPKSGPGQRPKASRAANVPAKNSNDKAQGKLTCAFPYGDCAI